jgi:hypothetical protein
MWHKTESYRKIGWRVCKLAEARIVEVFLLVFAVHIPPPFPLTDSLLLVSLSR